MLEPTIAGPERHLPAPSSLTDVGQFDWPAPLPGSAARDANKNAAAGAAAAAAGGCRASQRRHRGLAKIDAADAAAAEAQIEALQGAAERLAPVRGGGPRPGLWGQRRAAPRQLPGKQTLLPWDLPASTSSLVGRLPCRCSPWHQQHPAHPEGWRVPPACGCARRSGMHSPAAAAAATLNIVIQCVIS